MIGYTSALMLMSDPKIPDLNRFLKYIYIYVCVVQKGNEQRSIIMITDEKEIWQLDIENNQKNKNAVSYLSSLTCSLPGSVL